MVYDLNAAALSLKRPLLWSLAFHAFLFASLLVSTLRSHRGEVWGGPGGGAVTVGLVGNLPGIPLPRPEVMTPSRVADESKGLYKSEPKPKESESESKQLPEFTREKRPRDVPRPSRVFEDQTPAPSGAIPYGQGGAPSLPYTELSLAGGAQGGMGFSGPGGDFAGRFPEYVNGVRRRVSSNWLQSTVDPMVRWAPRAVVTFQILRDGSIVNVQFLRSSGNRSVDNSVLRAVLESSPLDRLPSEYGGSYVMVEFWFDFRR